MASELAGALPLPLSGDEGDGFGSMIGDADSIRFIAVVRTGLSSEELLETSYFRQISTFGPRLIRRSKARFDLKKVRTQPMNTDRIYVGINEIRFNYLNHPEVTL